MRSLLLVSLDVVPDAAALLETGADALAFDLRHRNSAPDGALRAMRAGTALTAARQSAPGACLYVWIDPLVSDHIDQDLDDIMPYGPSGLILSHAQNGADVQHLSVKLAVREAQCGFEDGKTKIIAACGTSAASCFQMGSFAGASTRLTGLLFARDELRQVFAGTTDESPGDPLPAPIALARSLMLLGAKAAKVAAIDAAVPSTADAAGLQRACEAAKGDGFCGKVALDRDQIAVLHRVFTPEC